MEGGGERWDTWWVSLGFPKIRGYHFGGLHNKDYNILGSILGSPYFGKLPFRVQGLGGLRNCT